MSVPTSEVLKDQLTKSPDDSKKARMARLGLIGIGTFFLSGIVTMFFRPETSTQVVLLVQFTIGAWTTVVVAYLGAQGSVDYKTTQVLGNIAERS